MTKPNVAFIVLTWNSQQYIENCVNSIFNCESFSPHVFVVDNGSSDNTPEILHKLEEKHPDLSCIYLPENLGTTVSRNKPLDMLPENCDYVCILDSDTIINDQAISTMIEALASSPDIGLMGPTMINSAGEKQLSGRNLPSIGIKLRKAAPLKSMRQAGARKEVPAAPIRNGLQDVPYLLSACWLMPLSTIRTVGTLDENIFYAPEDVDYCVRVHQHGLRVVKCWNAEIIHEYQRLSHKKLLSKTNVEHIKGLVYYFKKHHYLFDSDNVLKTKVDSQ